jgi:hypothetical protein
MCVIDRREASGADPTVSRNERSGRARLALDRAVFAFGLRVGFACKLFLNRPNFGPTVRMCSEAFDSQLTSSSCEMSCTQINHVVKLGTGDYLIAGCESMFSVAGSSRKGSLNLWEISGQNSRNKS